VLYRFDFPVTDTEIPCEALIEPCNIDKDDWQIVDVFARGKLLRDYQAEVVTSWAYRHKSTDIDMEWALRSIE